VSFAEPIEISFEMWILVQGSMYWLGVHICTTWRMRLNRHVWQWSGLFMVALTIIFSSCFFLLLFLPRLISAVGDLMFTILPHMVWS